MNFIHWLMFAAIPSFMDWFWWLDGDCFGC